MTEDSIIFKKKCITLKRRWLLYFKNEKESRNVWNTHCLYLSLCYSWEEDPRKLTCDSSLRGRYRNFAQIDLASLKGDKTMHSNHVSLLSLLLDYCSNYHCCLPNIPCSFPWGHMVELCYPNHFEPGLCHFQIQT